MDNITGRDRYVLVKALVYAIAAIDSRPSDQQERSDRDDMARLLEAMCPDEGQRQALDLTVKSHLA